MSRAASPRLQDRAVPNPLPTLPAELSPVLARLYASRGVQTADDLDYRLASLPDPRGIQGLQTAAETLADAVMADRRVLVVGDFDADGATSTALAIRCLEAFGATRVDFLVPNRFEYGYGLTEGLVQVARERSPDLIMTVDNGISAHEGVEAAKAASIPVVITDHHLPGPSLPDAVAIVNPRVNSEAFEGQALAGVGVCFCTMLGVRRVLRERGWFDDAQPEPNLVAWLDLVALGTVADVVPMDRMNRLLVSHGLKRIRAGHGTAGVNALLDIAGRQSRRVTAADMGFAAGPRLNAAGRLGDMSVGIELLLTEDPARAAELAAQLDGMNRRRRELETSMREEALIAIQAAADANPDNDDRVLCLFDPEWHQGVIGIVASRLKDHFQRPVIAFAPGEDGWIKGSGRSIPGVHIRDLVEAIDTRTRGELIQQFGGHAMAAGLTLRETQYDTFQQVLDQVSADWPGLSDNGLVIETDGELNPDEFTLRCARAIREGGPWGPGFPEPCFRGFFTILTQREVGQGHLKLSLRPTTGDASALDAIAFNAMDRGWDQLGEGRVEAVFRLDVNHFRGQERLQLVVEHLAAA
ncbi:single-stranded-DNA-specific exonuclease RecJ [Spiribacter sp. 2438]|uniref:single-stranded-DNA-specific exonuclease RecJ n=1 Tax=Spiribacter sp. 2438 TaxID=2666185 RepID=UPI0012B0D427|nr:single-stranded-DNA-specific exonuclease RecJ [Spiribacter sp. 2438]QGM21632.1 single-stranded-DNA-specific exonuclease RecJ [Spiribacter sp. 2438]